MRMNGEHINQLMTGFFPDRAGLDFVEADDGSCECRMQLQPHHHNPAGIVHGGAAYTLADTAMSLALLSCYDEFKAISTVEIKISYFEAATQGEFAAKARVIKQGKRVSFVECDVLLGDTVVARASGSFVAKDWKSPRPGPHL